MRGGEIVLDSEILKADVTIRRGRVSALSAPGSASSEGVPVFDADGALVLPGGVDVHTHVGLPFGEFSTLDDFASASRAAAQGGTTTFLEFAIPTPDETPMAAVQRRMRQSEGVSHVDFGFHGCVARCADHESLEDVARLARMGVTSVKVFTAYRGIVMLELGDVRAVMEAAVRHGCMVMVHAETESLVERSIHDLRSEGLSHARYQARARPAEAELDAARSVLGLARVTGCPTYLVHVTLPEVADALAQARSQGVEAFGESCPHYLLLDESCYSSARPELFVCSPPLRPGAAAAALWSYLGHELIGVHSDHCCFNGAQKSQYAEDLTRIPPGVPGIETRLPLMLSEALNGRIGLTSLVEFCSSKPARLFGIPLKGSLLPGYDGDLLIVDPEGENEITGGLHMSTDFSPFQGRRLRGRIHTVVARGRVLIKDGEWTGLPAGGRFLKRRTFAAPADEQK